MYNRRFWFYPVSEYDFWRAHPLLPEIGKQKNLFIFRVFTVNFKAFTENFSVFIYINRKFYGVIWKILTFYGICDIILYEGEGNIPEKINKKFTKWKRYYHDNSNLLVRCNVDQLDQASRDL